MNVNFAERAHNHNWKLDPIVRSLLDTDFYKLLMPCGRSTRSP